MSILNIIMYNCTQILEDTFKVDIKYTYDRKHNKVYDIDSAVKEFNMLIKKLV